MSSCTHGSQPPNPTPHRSIPRAGASQEPFRRPGPLPASIPAPSAAALHTSNEEADDPQRERRDQYEPEKMRGKAQPAEQREDEQENNDCDHVASSSWLTSNRLPGSPANKPRVVLGGSPQLVG